LITGFFYQIINGYFFLSIVPVSLTAYYAVVVVATFFGEQQTELRADHNINL
jgi:hypothetical protein